MRNKKLFVLKGVPDSLKSTAHSMCSSMSYAMLENSYDQTIVSPRRLPVVDFMEATIGAQTARHLADLEVSWLMLPRNASDPHRHCHGRLDGGHSKSMPT